MCQVKVAIWHTKCPSGIENLSGIPGFYITATMRSLIIFGPAYTHSDKRQAVSALQTPFFGTTTSQ
jgi:hypothetical protein